MPRYLVQAAYTSSAAAAFVNEPQDRLAGIRAVTKKVGGKLISLDFSLGEHDIVCIAELPDDEAAVALALAINAPGHIRSYQTTRLLTPAEFLAAQEKAHGLTYKAPR